MTYTCDICGSTFQEPHTIKYQEYPGACFVEDYVSPCCHARYTEEE